MAVNLFLTFFYKKNWKGEFKTRQKWIQDMEPEIQRVKIYQYPAPECVSGVYTMLHTLSTAKYLQTEACPR